MTRLSEPRASRLVLLGLVIGGGALRLLVASQDLFADELATYWVVSTRGLADVVQTVSTPAEITPPVSFMLAWLTTRIGLDEVLLRLPALLAGLASIPLVHSVGVRTVGRRPALLGATLVTLSPFMVFYSAEARGYAVAMALTLLSTWLLLRATDDDEPRWWWAHAAIVCLAAYTHYTVVFVLAAQFVWAFLAHPRSRRPLVLATAGAAVLYLPWVPSLKGDLDSPTTAVLSALSPFDLEAARVSLGHWSIGYPFNIPGARLSDVPGTPALVLLAAGLVLGAIGALTGGALTRERLTAHHGAPVLVVVMALATPVGTALQSAVGNNVFSTRTLAASLPYLALVVAAVLLSGRPAVRIAAATLVVVSYGIGAAAMADPDLRRPQYSELAAFADGASAGAVVDLASFTPGPLTNFDVEGSVPDAPVFRVTIPEQKEVPFAPGQPRPDPADVARRAVAAAGDAPIVIISHDPPLPPVADFVALLPEGYELTDVKATGGFFALQAMVYERTGS